MGYTEFDYDFTETEGITLGSLDVNESKINSLQIYYGNEEPNQYVDVMCTRWDEGNWDVTIEIFCNSSSRNTLYSYVTPGAVREMYNILGTPYYWDITYTSGNTLYLVPNSSQVGGKAKWALSSLRVPRRISVKGISDTFINQNYFNVKIEGYILV